MHQSMNTSYRLVWNESTGTWSVAHELARGHGKARSARRTLTAIQCAVLIAGLIQAPPLAHADIIVQGGTITGTASPGGNVVVGQNTTYPASINQTVVGDNATSAGQDATAIGSASYAAAGATAVGRNATASFNFAVAVGAAATRLCTTQARCNGRVWVCTTRGSVPRRAAKPCCRPGSRNQATGRTTVPGPLRS